MEIGLETTNRVTNCDGCGGECKRIFFAWEVGMKFCRKCFIEDGQKRQDPACLLNEFVPCELCLEPNVKWHNAMTMTGEDVLDCGTHQKVLRDIRVRVSRTKVERVDGTNCYSVGASYTHIRSLQGILGPKTKRVVMYHSMLESLDLDGLEGKIDMMYLGFNRIEKFEPNNNNNVLIGVLDLAGNPIKSLVNCPNCEELIVSSTLIENLVGLPKTVKIVRCGHSSLLKSLIGLHENVELVECACSPNLVIDSENVKWVKELIK